MKKQNKLENKLLRDYCETYLKLKEELEKSEKDKEQIVQKSK